MSHRLAAALAAFVLVSGSAAAGAGVILPLSASAGPVPVPYYPADFRLYPTVPTPIAPLTDGDPLTGTAVNGLDNIPDNSVFIDTGAFVLLRYQVPPDTQFLRLRYRARVSYVDPFQYIQPTLLVPEEDYFLAFSASISTSLPIDRTVTFTPAGNNGGWVPHAHYRVQDVIAADGTVWVGVQAGMTAALNLPGRVEAFFSDVELSVPEPAGAVPLILAALTRRKRGPRRGNPKPCRFKAS